MPSEDYEEPSGLAIETSGSSNDKDGDKSAASDSSEQSKKEMRNNQIATNANNGSRDHSLWYAY